jgi:Tfp pilus assembly protein PilF
MVSAPANAAVTVIGGGLGQSCYEAVEYARLAPSQALAICDLALEQERLSRRDRAATLTNRGILHMRDGRNQRALADYQKSLSLAPDLVETKVNVGAALYGLKRYPEALQMLTEGIATESVDARATGFYNRGLVQEKLGDLQKSYEDFRAALDLKPDFEMAAQQLSRFVVETVPG